MKLYKALKLKKSLIGEIAKIQKQIEENNSYLLGSINGEKTDVHKLNEQMLEKIDQLTGLKYAINEANQEIQSKIYVLSEYKALISFWTKVSVVEGNKAQGYSETVKEYKVHFSETERDELIKSFQVRVNVIQDEIDVYNHQTDIPWDEVSLI